MAVIILVVLVLCCHFRAIECEYRFVPDLTQTIRSDMKTLEMALQSEVGNNSIYYLVTGDTQFWTSCTPANKGCHRAVKRIHSNKPGVVLQNEYANSIQKTSMLALNTIFQKVTNRSLQGLVINGDLTQHGYKYQYDRLHDEWLSLAQQEGIKVYPGLGNHDYENNVNDCIRQNCSLRMMNWLVNYTKNTLGLIPDVTESYSAASAKRTYRGSLSYSWDDCVGGICYHFVQLNNHPFHNNSIMGPGEDWFIEDSLNWLEEDLYSANPGKPTVVHFHKPLFNWQEFMIDATDGQRKKLLQILGSNNILGIFYAHLHWLVGVHHKPCFKPGTVEVPTIFTGSVPGSNYMLIHLKDGNLHSAYQFHVSNNSTTKFRKTDLKMKICEKIKFEEYGISDRYLEV